jgi:hypothetical protein
MVGHVEQEIPPHYTKADHAKIKEGIIHERYDYKLIY